MIARTASTTQSWHFASCDAEIETPGLVKTVRALLTSLGWAASLMVPGTALAAVAPEMGAAGSFAVLGATTVTNTGPTKVTGDLGLSPGTSITGFPPGIVIGGTIQKTTPAAANAQVDAMAAFIALAAQPCNFGPSGPTDLNTQTLAPGVHCYSSSVQNSGTVTLSGTASDVWVFKIGTTLTAGPGSVVVTGGAKSCNVFWQVGSAATLNTTSNVPGTIIALDAITLNTGASMSGRALALTGAVTLDSNNVSVCSLAPPISPTITVTKVSNGGVGAFSFTGSNGFPLQTITTMTPGTGVAGATQTLTAAGMMTEITESAPPAGFALTSIACSGLGAQGTATGNIGTRTVKLDAAATAAGSAIACTFTNTFAAAAPTVTVTKVSNGGVGTFSFTGTNGFPLQTITTMTPGTGVAGATQTLTAAGMMTEITESAPPAGFALTSIACSGLGAQGTATGNIGTRTVTLNAAATAAGAAIACTFTNASTSSLPAAGIPTLTAWGMIVLSGLLALFGFAVVRRHARQNRPE